MPFLSGSRSGRPHEELYWRQGNRIAVRVGDWKLLRNSRQPGGDWELYDLSTDLTESNNQIDSNPDRAEKLREVLERFDSQMVERAF